jgi:hypothetical protein
MARGPLGVLSESNDDEFHCDLPFVAVIVLVVHWMGSYVRFQNIKTVSYCDRGSEGGFMLEQLKTLKI